MQATYLPTPAYPQPIPAPRLQAPAYGYPGGPGYGAPRTSAARPNPNIFQAPGQAAGFFPTTHPPAPAMPSSAMPGRIPGLPAGLNPAEVMQSLANMDPQTLVQLSNMIYPPEKNPLAGIDPATLQKMMQAAASHPAMSDPRALAQLMQQGGPGGFSPGMMPHPPSLTRLFLNTAMTAIAIGVGIFAFKNRNNLGMATKQVLMDWRDIALRVFKKSGSEAAEAIEKSAQTAAKTA